MYCLKGGTGNQFFSLSDPELSTDWPLYKTAPGSGGAGNCESRPAVWLIAWRRGEGPRNNLTD